MNLVNGVVNKCGKIILVKQIRLSIIFERSVLRKARAIVGDANNPLL